MWDTYYIFSSEKATQAVEINENENQREDEMNLARPRYSF